MKNIALVLLSLFYVKCFCQENVIQTFSVIINPDLKVDFPLKPTKSSKGKYMSYSTIYENNNFVISSEPFPINYKGKLVAEAEGEFYPTFTNRLINNRRIKNILEKDTTFENHFVRELQFTEILPNGKEQYVFLKAIMVSGFEGALYIITLTNFDGSSTLTKMQTNLLNSLDLYYNFENELSTKNTKKILKKKRFKVEEN